MTRPHGITRYKHGPDESGAEGKSCHCAVCREASRSYERHRTRMAAYGWARLLDAAGTRRRVQALIWCGWSFEELAAAYGSTSRAIRKTLSYTRVSPATAARIGALYDALWDQPPPAGTPHERRAATMARQYARDRGWVAPLAWDDAPGSHCIDDPDAVPASGWERRDGVRAYGILGEEITELIGFGVEPRVAAVRAGASQKTLERVLALQREERRAA